MDKQLPKIYNSKINKKLNNTTLVYSTLNNEKETKNIEKPNHKLNDIGLTVRQKIHNIFKSPNYIYKADVTIVTNSNTMKKRIVGKTETSLITFDNEYINISDIKDIY